MRAQLHGARGQLRVLAARQAGRDGALHPHHELRAHRGGDRMRLGRLLGVDDDLGDAVAVAEVEEDELAEVTSAIDPARQAGGPPDVLGVGRRRR